MFGTYQAHLQQGGRASGRNLVKTLAGRSSVAGGQSWNESTLYLVSRLASYHRVEIFLIGWLITPNNLSYNAALG